jgi:hypothetical protein
LAAARAAQIGLNIPGDEALAEARDKLGRAAAFLAISLRRFLLSVAARAFPPFAPSSAAPLRSGSTSSSSPVAIRITFTALPITSAGRFSPCGPLGIGLLLLGELDALLLAGNLLDGVSLNAVALLVGLCEASLCLRDYLAVWGGWLVASALAMGHA